MGSDRDEVRVYVIGDVHGHLDLLKGAHARIEADRQLTGDASAPTVHLGDLCDRGPDSRGVLDYLVDRIAEGAPWRLVRGNHDLFFEAFLEDPEIGAGWLGPGMGGMATLASFGVETSGRPVADIGRDFRSAVPDAHRRLLAGMEPFIETPDLILVHAGLRPGVPLAQQDPDDLIWIREPFLFDDTDYGKLVVHGHTPVDAPMHCGNRVALDTGAAFGGPLTAAVFEGRDCHILTDGGRVRLPPP